MIDTKDAHEIMRASIFFHELFKKALLTDFFPGVTTKTQMDLLMTLMLNGPMSMSTLSERAGIAPEQATRAIRSLREAGLVQSERSATNRRVVVARITEKGSLLMDDHERQIVGNLATILSELDDAEIAHLADLSQQACDLLGKTGFKHIVPE